jgi:hypothetical protein
LSIAVIFSFEMKAQAQQHRVLQKCLDKQTKAVEKQGTVTVSFYPMNSLTKAIPAFGAGFSDSVGAEDLTARLFNLTIIKSLESNANTIQDDPRLLIRDVSPYTSDIIVFASRNRVVFFPRPLLHYPAVRSFELNSGDLIGSLSGYKKEPGNPKPKTTLDQLYERCFPSETNQDRKIRVLLNGPLMKAEKRGPQTIEGGLRLSTFSSDHSLAPKNPMIDTTAHVLVLSRNVNGVTASVICPCFDSGDFGRNGSGFNNLIPNRLPEDSIDDYWERLFTSVYVPLLEGDQLELTFLPLVFPFNRQ